MEGEAVSALSTFLSNVGTVLTSATGWIGTIVGVIVETPVLLVPVGMGIAAGAISLFHRLRG